MAEFIMKSLVKESGMEQNVVVESAATSSKEVGSEVYLSARQKLAEHHIDCSGKIARQLLNNDYDNYDLLVGMDRESLSKMYWICGGDFADKMHLLMDFTDHPGEIADPLCTKDFDKTWLDIEEGCRGLLRYIQSPQVCPEDASE